MQSSDIPTKFPIPWGDAAGGGYIRPIPEASQIGIQDGAASLTDGYPPLCFVPVGSGGTPPFGQDMNGILKQITQWNQWQQAGAPVLYDSTFQTAIGGYPLGVVVGSVSTPGVFWQSTAENNTTNPDAAGAGWRVIAYRDPGTAGVIIYGTGSNGAGLQLLGNGGTTPKKWIRAKSGILDIMNDAYSAAILSLTDAGALSVPGNVTSTAGSLRAAVGAFGSGDTFRATLLSDFVLTVIGTDNMWERRPDGLIDQTIAADVPAGGGLVSTPISLPVTFPTAILDAIISFRGSTPPDQSNPGSVCVEPTSTSQVTVTTAYANSATMGVVIRARGH